MRFSSWLMAWIISSFGSIFVCFMKESFFTNLESRFLTSLTHFVYNTWIFSSVDCKGTTNFSKSWHTWTMNDSVGSVLRKYSFKFSYCSIIPRGTLSRMSQRVWQCFITHCVDTSIKYNLLLPLQIVWKRNIKSIANWSTFTLSFKHLIPSKKALFVMWIEHVPTFKKYVTPLFWSSSTAVDLNHLLTLGPSISKASNKLMSNPRC